MYAEVKESDQKKERRENVWKCSKSHDRHQDQDTDSKTSESPKKDKCKGNHSKIHQSKTKKQSKKKMLKHQEKWMHTFKGTTRRQQVS